MTAEKVLTDFWERPERHLGKTRTGFLPGTCDIISKDDLLMGYVRITKDLIGLVGNVLSFTLDLKHLADVHIITKVLCSAAKLFCVKADYYLVDALLIGWEIDSV